VTGLFGWTAGGFNRDKRVSTRHSIFGTIHHLDQRGEGFAAIAPSKMDLPRCALGDKIGMGENLLEGLAIAGLLLKRCQQYLHRIIGRGGRSTHIAAPSLAG
jgi:hypothetical protein